MKNTLLILLFSVLSSVLMFLGWPTIGFFPLLFLGLVPMMIAIDRTYELKSNWKVLVLFIVVFVSHILWIGASLRWVHEASPKTYYIAISLESFSIALASLPMFFIRKFIGEIWSWLFFLGAWLAVEYFNQHWMLGTPYFLLGSGFGMFPSLIQVYEWIGVEGGSFFLLGTNISMFLVLKNWRESLLRKKLGFASLLFISPFIFSFLIGKKVESSIKSEQVTLAALHTDIETFSSYSHQYPQKIVNGLWEMGKNADLKETDVLIWPETVISNMGWLHNLANEEAYKTMIDYMKEYPELSVCMGGYGYSLAKNGDDPYSRYDETNKYYYNSHNVAVTVNNSGRWPIRSKEVFIPFQERIPFLKQMPFLRDFADIVGANTMVSFYEFGDNIHRTFKGDRFVPVLCFESIYPLNMAQSAKEVDFMAILANEHWNKNLDGSHQYLYNNVAMAIQSRTPIVRSSNSGLSAIINRNGEIVTEKNEGDIGIIKSKLTKKTDQTVYETISGLFYWTGILLFFGLLIVGVIKRILGTKIA